MPQIFRMGEYWIYFWTNENKPIEPIHVHIAKGRPAENATKVWTTANREKPHLHMLWRTVSQVSEVSFMGTDSIVPKTTEGKCVHNFLNRLRRDSN